MNDTKRRKDIAAALRQVLVDADKMADELMAKYGGHAAQRTDRNCYKLGALEAGIKVLIDELERDDNYGRTK